MNDDTKQAILVLGTVILAVAAVFAVALAYNYFVYGDASCMFARCVKVVP